MVENLCGDVWNIFSGWIGDKRGKFDDVYAGAFGRIGDICGVASSKSNYRNSKANDNGDLGFGENKICNCV